jgi:ceramide glucosyltransferase
MEWYHVLAIILIFSQVLFLLRMLNNYNYVLSKYTKERLFRPRTALIVPCRGLDTNFHENIESFFKQDYKDYVLFFVVGEESDEAYPELCKLRDKLKSASKAQDIQILIAGPTKSCSQKTHNLLYAYKQIDDSIEVLAFADSDAFLRPEWLSHIVYPLRKDKNGAASGYRWFVPKRNNLASLALAGINAKIAQLLGNTRFNQAWGGSMAIRVDTFRALGLDKMWPKVVSDDYALSYAVKKSGRKVAFVPGCIVASHETMTWTQLFEFARRQFIITRVSMAGLWWFGLGCILYSVLGLWGSAAMAIWGPIPPTGRLIFGMVALVFFLSQMCRAIFRQRMIYKLLERDRNSMRYARTADITLFWVWSLLLLVFYISSAFGRTICWRGIRYKIHSLTNMTLIERT